MIQIKTYLHCNLLLQIPQNNRLVYSFADYERNKKSYKFEISGDYI